MGLRAGGRAIRGREEGDRPRRRREPATARGRARRSPADPRPRGSEPVAWDRAGAPAAHARAESRRPRGGPGRERGPHGRRRPRAAPPGRRPPPAPLCGARARAGLPLPSARSTEPLRRGARVRALARGGHGGLVGLRNEDEAAAMVRARRSCASRVRSSRPGDRDPQPSPAPHPAASAESGADG